ncbi:PREDICTED: uncharacterized protein LOC106814055 isoform X2 [Priapulus caudatus]|uniref:Uncharacterized protein LOC106814055 isoform X2 n=1 Tax=Priapulus caudatus TaxID=37621 RepID=A0ABM1ENN9_PRICU|nr:PREDICTED: uncharacterized protein LOC106814055 isoform X2 [Priapulus caudatus]
MLMRTDQRCSDQRTEQDGTLKIRMIILASVTGAGIQEFSVTIGYSPHRSAAIRLEALQRINIYAVFRNCAITDGVDQELCACNLKRSFPDFTAIKLISQGKYVNVFGKPSQIRIEIIRESRDKFGKSERVEIAIIKRNVGDARVVYEVANPSEKTVSFYFSLTATNCDVSANETQQVTLRPRDMRFLSIVVPWSGPVKCSHNYSLTTD